MESCSNQKSVKHLKIYFIFEIVQSSNPLPWWQLCTNLAFSQPVSPGMLFQQLWRSSTYAEHWTPPKPSQLGWGQVIVNTRSSHTPLHHTPSWPNSPYTAWSVGSLSCWKTNDSPTKLKPDGMAYHCRMLW